jgi:hypothetical protein
MKTLICIILLLSAPKFVLAQTALQKKTHYTTIGYGIAELETPFGNVPKEDLLMSRYEPDTSTNAVVLLDNGFLSLNLGNDGFHAYLTCFHRVKLFKKSAFDDYGKHTISIRRDEKLITVKAQTVNPDGKIIPVSEFFDAKINQSLDEKRFIFSNLQEGSIVEYVYCIEGKDIFSLYPWYFQAAIPVRHSEITLDFHYPVIYKHLFNGIQPKSDKHELIRKFNLNSEITYEPLTYPRYYLDTVAAAKPESYMNTISNYISNLKFQLREVNLNQDSKKREKVIQDWKALAIDLTNEEALGKQLSNTRNYHDVWKAVKPLLINAKTDKEKMSIIYEYISRNVAWIEDYFSIYAQESSLDDAFKKKKANSGELNMMLIACLNEAGINALPLLISTRGNGEINKEYPIIRQFNHLLCYIENGNNPLFLDAGNIHRPMGVPRVPSLNGVGWVLDKNKPRWVDIPAPLSSETTLMNMDLLEDGMLKGTINSNYSGYAAVDERTSLKNDEKNEIIKKEWAKLFPDIQLNNIVVTNLDSSYLPFKRVMNCTIPNAAIVVDDLIYLKPTLKTAFDENPFKAEKRNYPIELPYPISNDYIFNVSIPEGYIVEELPKDISIDLLKDGGKFIYSCKKTDAKIELIVHIELKQLHFEVKEYENVKAFFNQIVNKKNEQIVLKKKAKGASAKK